MKRVTIVRWACWLQAFLLVAPFVVPLLYDIAVSVPGETAIALCYFLALGLMVYHFVLWPAALVAAWYFGVHLMIRAKAKWRMSVIAAVLIGNTAFAACLFMRSFSP